MKSQITLTLLPIGLVVFCLTFGHITIAAPGDLDPTFSGDGKVTTGFGFGPDDAANGIAVLGDGKIVAVGEGRGSDGTSDFALARYLGG